MIYQQNEKGDYQPAVPMEYFAGVDWEVYDNYAFAYNGEEQIAVVNGKGRVLKAKILLKHLTLLPHYGRLTNKYVMKEVVEKYTTQFKYACDAAEELENKIKNKYGNKAVKDTHWDFVVKDNGFCDITVTAQVRVPNNRT